MTIEERAELEQLRQQNEALGKAPGGGGQDLLHRLRSLPEDEAVALLLQVRSEARVDQVSPGDGASASAFAHGGWVSNP